MLTFEEAKKIGINACIDKLGRDFVREHRDNGVSCYGEEDGIVSCYVGIDDKPCIIDTSGPIVLDHESHFPYYANCYVNRTDGKITFGDSVLPA